MKEQANGFLLCIFGAIFVLVNKPFGEAFRQWQVMISGKDYGVLSFQVPIIALGALMMLLGISFFF